MKITPVSFLIPDLNEVRDINNLVNQAKEKFAKLRSQNQFVPLDKGYLIYQVIDQNRTFKGIVCGVLTEQFADQTILHHEKTIPLKEMEQAQIAQDQGGFCKPILMTHRPVPNVRNIIDRYLDKEPIIEVYIKSYKTTHKVWKIENPEEETEIKKAYSEIDHALIVDGHHRSQAINILSKRGVDIHHGMCSFFDFENLEILPFHRILDANPNLSVDELIIGLKKFGQVKKNPNSSFPGSESCIHFYYQDQHLALHWSSDILNQSEAVLRLDVHLVNEFIFHSLLNINSVRKSDKIDYIEGNATLNEIKMKLSEGPNKMAILLHPIDIEDIINITSNHVLLPPKSTWFLPRLANGIVTYTFND